MNWITKKIVLSKLSQYFSNLNEDDIELSILVHHHIKLRNMSLKTDIFLSDDDFIIPTQCRIGYLELEFDLSSDTPLSIKVSNANIFFKINQNTRKEQKLNDDYKIIKQYESYLKMKQDYGYKSFFQRKKQQMKDWFIGLLAEKTSLYINNIQMAVEYPLLGKTHYIGISLQNINIKSRTIINEQSINYQQKFVQLTGFGMFVGIENQVNLIKKQGQNRQTWVLKRSINKLYFLKNGEISFRLNLFNKIAEAQISNFIINATPTSLKQIMEFVRYLLPLLNRARPRTKPGSGQKKKLGDTIMTQGSADWWKYLSLRVLQLISKRRRYNVLLNPSYRKYLYCLLISLVYQDKNQQIIEQIHCFEVRRPILQILKARQYLIQRISSIQNGFDYQRRQNIGFIKLIGSFKKQGYLSLKQIKYQDIQRARKWNIQNGRNYIKKLQIQNLFKFQVKIKCKKLSLFLCENNLLYDFVKLNKLQKMNQTKSNQQSKDQYIRKVGGNFLKHALNELKEGFRKDQFEQQWNIKNIKSNKNVITVLQINNLVADIQTHSKIELLIDNVTMKDLNKIVYNSEILKIQKISILQTLVNRQMRAQSLDQQNAKIRVYIDHFSLTAQKPFIQKLIFLVGLVDLDIATVQTVIGFQKTMREALYQNISKNNKNQQKNNMSLNVRRLNIMLPCDYSTKGDIFGLQLLHISVGLQSNIEFVEIGSIRIAFVNSYLWKQQRSFSLINQKQDRLKQSLIMNLGQMKVSNQHMIDKKNKNNKNLGINIISVTDFVIPLICIEISIKQLFLLSYLITLWKSTNFSPLSSLYVKSPLKRRKNHQYLSKNQQVLITNVIQRVSFSILGIAISFVPLKRQKQQCLFWIFLNDFDLNIIQKSFSSVINCNLGEIFVENISNHFPINKGILERFTYRLLKDGDKKKKNKTSNMDSLNLLLQKDISEILPKQSYKMKSNLSFNPSFLQDDPQDILNAFQFRQGQKNYLSKKLVIMNQGEKFLRISINDHYNLETHQQQQIIKSIINPIHIVFEVIFFRNLNLLIDFAASFSKKKLQIFYDYMKDKGILPLKVSREQKLISFIQQNSQQNLLLNDQTVVIDAKLSKYTKIYIQMNKILLMTFHHNSITYCINIADIRIDIEQKYLFTDIDATLNSLHIVDTKDDSGHKKEILSLKGGTSSLKAFIRSFKNQVLMNRHNCSSSAQIKINGLQAIFLKKKIIQLVDVVKYFASQLKDHKQQEQRIIEVDDNFTKIEKQAIVENKTDNFGSHYIVQLTDSKILIMQNSVDNRYVVGTVRRAIISNKFGQQQIPQQNSFRDKDQFEDCQGLDVNNQQFISFEQQKFDDNSNSNQKIYINIQEIDIFDQGDNHLIDPIISANIVRLEIITRKQLIIGVQLKRLEGDLNQDQYTFIMRMLDQNFDEVANVLTPKGPYTESLSMDITVTIHGIFLQLDVPTNLIQDIQAEIEQLQVKVFMYQNDKKQIKLGMGSMTIKNVVKNDRQIILKTFVPLKSLDKATISKLQMIQNYGRQTLQKQFQQRDIIKQNTLVKGGQQVYSLKMSMMENRQQFMIDFYHAKPQIKQSKMNKIAKRIARFCGKCCQCCIKNKYKIATTTQGPDDEIRSNQRLMSNKQLDVDIPFKHSMQMIKSPSQVKDQHIEDSRLILRRKCYPTNVFDLNNTQDEFLNFYMFTQANPSYQKVKKVRVANISVNVQQQHILMSLINFITYPFNTRNTNIKQNRKYNRFPPSSFQIQLQNVRLVIGNGMTDYFYNSIEILFDMKFIMQDQGDITYGPGQQKWDANACININYCKGNSQNKYLPISLCKDTKFTYTKNIKVPFYKNMNETHQKKQLFYLTGINNQIHFKFPLTQLKFIKKLFKKVNSNPIEQTSTVQKPKQPVVLFSWIHEQQKAFIPQITIQLQRGLSRALIQVTLSKTYVQMEGIASLDKQYQKKTTAYGTISGSYVNMSSGYVQPFIESWTFQAKTQELFQQNQLMVLMKLASKDNENNERCGKNCLNINVTTSLLKNLKDAQTRYKHEGVVLDDCFYNMLDRKNYNIQVNESEQDLLISQYKFSNIDHRNFFGKKFIKLKGGKKISTDNKCWNLDLQPYIMLYSFLDQSIGRKIVQLRSPYSIRNICGTTVKLNFDVRKKSALDKWQGFIKDNQTYCIPMSIYDYDYLVAITLEGQPKGKAVSVLALLKQYQERQQFQQVPDNHPLYQKAFRLLQGNPKKFIAKNDTVLKAGNNILLAAIVKIQYQLLRTGFLNQQQKPDDIFQTQIMLIPPLIIKNELSMRMQMFIEEKSIIIQPNSQKIVIDLPENILNVQIYFKKVTSSKRFEIFSQKELSTVYQIHISEGYNINMKSIKMSQLGRYLILYSNYIIKNFTLQNFQIFHKGNKVLLEKSFWFFITQDEEKNINSKFSEINFYKGQGQPHKFDTNLQKQRIQLKRIIQINEQGPRKIRLQDQTQVLPGDQQFDSVEQKNKTCGCCKKKKKKHEINSRVKVYDFVMWIKHHQNQISKTLCIYYRYQVKNNTDQQFTLYHEDVEIFTMRPHTRQFLFQYQSKSNRFRIGYILKNKMGDVRAYSRPFKIDAIQDFMVKIKSAPQKSYPYDRNHLFRVIISQQQDLFLIQFMSAPSKEQFMLYLENSTSHNARIRQTDEDFYLPKKQKIPFFWSNLDFEKSNIIYIQIQGHSKQFIMNQLDQFQPLVLQQVNNQQKINGITYKKGYLGVNYKNIKGQYLCVCDVLKQTFTIFSQKSNAQFKKLERIKLLQAAYMNTNGKNIFVYLPDGGKMILLAPSQQEYTMWRQAINNSLTVRTFHKIMLRMQSTDTSRVLKLYQLQGDESKTIKRVQYNLNIDSLAITLIDSTPKQIVLLGIDRFRFFTSQEFRSNNIDTLVKIKQQHILQFGKVKLNNNLQNTEHPVIQAGSKKTQNPYFQLKTIRTYFHHYTIEEINHVGLLINKDKRINHYNTVRIFLDQTQIIIDNANFNEMKKVFSEVNQMIQIYSIQQQDQKIDKDVDIRHLPQYLKSAHQKELYINQLSIEPIKIVLSAKWNSNPSSELQTPSQLAILKAMPFGIDHAVVKLKGFVSFHVNQNNEVLLNRLKGYYMEDIAVQILKNAGSYELFVPLRIIKGVGSGAKEIFYDPIYTLFTKRDIKSSSTKVIQGCVSFVSTIVEVIFKFISVIFNLFAFLTFDSNYNARRNALLRTTMKNPRFAFVYAGYWYLKLIPEVIFGFYYRPKQQYQRKGLIGIPFGFFSACLGVIKLVIGIYDFIYCIWLGFANMADYEQQPMKYRTRPVRTFKNNIVKPYNKNEALAHQIMLKNKIDQIKNQSIIFAEQMNLKGKPVYIIITNYRLITAKETITYNSIKFYKIKEINRIENSLNIILNIADLVPCCICLTRKKRNFTYYFDEIEKAELVQQKLKDAITKNSQNALQKSQVLREIPYLKTGKLTSK